MTGELAGDRKLPSLRQRSFVERWVIARAPFFTQGKELDDAWVAALDATRLYKRLGNMRSAECPDPDTVEF